MKRLLLSFVSLFCAVVMMAVPAHPGTVKIQQPDGSYVTLRLVGDEWCHFNTTLDGYSVVKSNRGFYVYAEKKDGQLQPTERVAHDVADRSADEQAFLAGVKKYQAPEISAQFADLKSRVEAIGVQRRAQGQRATNYSKFRGLIILVQFNDREFSRPDYKDIITDMVNKENYTGFDDQKRSGSVRDYFSDNSHGKFKPQFDVVGPYTVDFSQYDCNYGKADSKYFDIALAAIDSADVDVNFKNYDGDGDGKVDLIFFIIAGNGANYEGNNEDFWWPHRGVVYNPNTMSWLRKDGVRLYDYASSVELAGYVLQPSTIMMDGIGTICHEFSHVLGLPDFYDADYEKDGQSITIGVWSLMDSGCYLDDGITPSGYSLYERYAVGFADEPEKIVGEGVYTLNPLHVDQKGLRIDSPVKNEFFLLENRQNGDFKWDAYLPGHGLLVYRVDKSNQSVWDDNHVNVKAERNYYELVRARGYEKMDEYTIATGYDPFPGLGKVTTLHNGTEPANLKTWSGKATKWGLFNISENDGVISFEIQDATTLKGLSLPDSAEVGQSSAIQLEPLLTPNYAVATLKWSSSNSQVATVDQQGIVKGISLGSCTISVTSDNGISDSCIVTVVSIPVATIDELKQMDFGSKVLLQLTNAEVLYVYQNTTYLRDEKGCITVSNADLGLKRNDLVTGVIYGLVGKVNNMLQLIGVDAATSGDNLTITGSKEVKPREVSLEELTEKDYADYVRVKAIQIERNNGVWAVSGDRRIRLSNPFQIQGINVPMNFAGKYYDVEGIFGTNVLNDEVIDELYRTAKLVEVEKPSGIVEMRQDVEVSNMPVYNLQGQRVSPNTKGLLIRGGRKLLNR